MSPSAIAPERLLCRQIMRAPVDTIGSGETVVAAARLMRDRDIGFMPVCNRLGAILGVLTDRDIVVRALTGYGDPLAVPVSQIMSRDPITCGLDDTIGHAEQLMREHRITRLVVLDTHRRPIGVLSLSDVAQYEHPSRVGRTVQAVAERKYGPERP